MRRKPFGPQRSTDDRTLPKYTIAVAAGLSGVPQQQLRRMEESGLVSPTRTGGKTRRYSDEDIAQIDEVAELAQAGINAAGIRVILEMRADLAAVRAEVAQLKEQLAQIRHDHGKGPGSLTLERPERA